MKQTNNAIKFLMAQYRAIFKNANIAMVAAMAAAALAAGQAQAAEEIGEANFGSIAAKPDGYTLDGSKSEPYSKINISSVKTDINNTNAFVLTLTGGADHKIESSADTAIVSVTAEKAGIKLDGQGVILGIGHNKSGASVKLNSLDVAQGTLNVGVAAATKQTTVDAKTITLGAAPAADGTQTAATGDAKVVIGVSGALGGATTTDFNAYAGSAITLDGPQNKSASIKANNINFKGGKLTVESGTQAITLDGVVNVDAASAPTINNSGTITLTKSATFGKGSVVQDAAATLSLTAPASGTSVLTFDASDYSKVFAGKLAVSGADNTSKFEINILGDEAIDLKTFVSGDTGVFVDTKLDKAQLNGGKLTVTANNAKSDGGKIFALEGAELVLNTFSGGWVDSKVGKFAVNNGTLTVRDSLTLKSEGADSTELTVSGANAVLNLDRKGSTASGNGVVNAGTIKIAGSAAATDATMNVKNGAWDVNALEISKGTVNVEKATLNVKGKLTTTKTTGLLKADASEVNAFGAGSLALGESGSVILNNTSTLVLKSSDVFTTDDAKDTLTVTAAAFGKGAVTATANSKIKFQKDEAGTAIKLSKTQYQALIDGTKFTGLFDGLDVDVGNVSGDVAFTGKDGILGGLSGKYDNAVGTTDSEVTSGSFDVGAAKVSGESLSLASGASLTLSNAAINGENFVSGKDASGNVVVGKVVLSDEKGNGLTLGGSGKIGSITVADTKGAGNSTVTFGEADNSGNVTVTGSVGEDTKELGNVIVNGSNVTVNSGDVYTHNVDINGGSLTLGKDQSLFIGSANGDLTSSIDGDVTATNLTLKGKGGSLNIAGNATVSVNNLVGASGVSINVGKDAIKSGSATLVAGSMSLAGGGLFIDPDYDQTKASAVVMNLSGTTTDKNAGTLDGKVAIGANAAFGVGFSSLAEMDALISDYLTGGHFTEDTTNGGVHNALVLNKSITVADKMGIMVGENAAISSVSGNQIDIAAGSALVITDNVFDVAADGSKTGAAIKFAGNSAKANVSGSELLLVGEFTAKDDALTIFSGTSAAVTGNMTIKSLNGLLVGTMSNGQVNLDLTQDETLLANAFVDSSAPIRELLLDSKRGDLGDGKGLGRDLVNKISSVSLSGAVVDAAAHAATYAGAQQAAVASVTTMADAMFGRVGAVGVEAASISATGSQTKGGVWLTPMYKSVDADGFNAEGASYGADVDLAGVAFGTDTVKGNMRFGAVFNIGSGDADGKGNGNGLKDEFDYYGFGVYSAMGFGNLALIGDASMTVISHEVEGLGLKGEADTTAVTMGLTGQYTVATPAVDVTPHLGARFIRLNTDSYDLVCEKGVVANTEFDVQNVFSIPVGVTLSKAFVTGGWALAPSADLTVAFNTGDTEAKSNTRFTGINKNIGLNTEVLDEVTYGLTVCLGAQYGAFGTSFGINYTGSENTDSFGVNAQARYMF